MVWFLVLLEWWFYVEELGEELDGVDGGEIEFDVYDRVTFNLEEHQYHRFVPQCHDIGTQNTLIVKDIHNLELSVWLDTHDPKISLDFLFYLPSSFTKSRLHLQNPLFGIVVLALRIFLPHNDLKSGEFLDQPFWLHVWRILPYVIFHGHFVQMGRRTHQFDQFPVIFIIVLGKMPHGLTHVPGVDGWAESELTGPRFFSVRMEAKVRIVRIGQLWPFFDNEFLVIVELLHEK